MKQKFTALVKIVFMGLFLLNFLNADAQRICGSVDYLNKQIQSDPSIIQRRQNIENQTRAYENALNKSAGAIVEIPVVVHVVYNTTTQNISQAQIQSQIDILNADYRKLNADTNKVPAMFKSLAADCKVEFVLAKRDPAGNATTGIVRKQTSTTSFTTNDNVKYSSKGGDDAWASSSYLNLWVCPLGGGLLGYAQFPGSGSALTDGVVINVTAFGNTGTATAPYNKGRTATHEVGHWLNLNHIWGDDNGACTGSDNVGDTPNQGSENYGCPTFPHASCSNTSDMFMNYMDYVDDACMNMFSVGQGARIGALFASGGARASLLTSLGGIAPSTGTTCAIPTGLTSNSITSNSAIINWTAVTGATSYNVQYKTAASATFTSVSSSTNTLNLTGLIANTAYTYQIQTVCSGGTSAYTSASTFTTSAAASCAVPSGISVSSITSSAAVISWTAVSGATGYKVQYKTTAASAYTSLSSATNSVTLTGLSASTIYSYQVQSVCSASSSSSFSTLSNFSTIANSTCTDNYESNETKSTAKAITTGVTINAKIGTSTDIDWFSFGNTTAAKNIQVVLNNLPADYDLYIYNSSGTLLTSSLNSGNTAETVKYNNGTIGTYYVKVVGYSSAFNSSTCYALTVNISNVAFRLGAPESFMPESNYSIFPNPAQNEVNIDFTLTSNKLVEVRIFDITGKLVKTNTYEGVEGLNKNMLDISDLNKGIYMFECNDGDKVQTTKLFIEK